MDPRCELQMASPDRSIGRRTSRQNRICQIQKSRDEGDGDSDRSTVRQDDGRHDHLKSLRETSNHRRGQGTIRGAMTEVGGLHPRKKGSDRGWM